jgi:hypothetical protein
MKLEDLLRIPRMEDNTIDGALYNTGLNDCNVNYFCDAMGIDSTLTDEEKRDIITPLISQANPFGANYDPTVYEKLKGISEDYKAAVANNTVSIDAYQNNEEELEDEVHRAM